MSFQRFTITPEDARKPLGAWLTRQFGVAAGEAAQMVREQRVWLQGRVCLDVNLRLQRGQQIEIRPPRKSAQSARSTPKAPPTPTPTLTSADLYHLDEHLLVVNKPAGLTTMRHAEDVAEFGSRARKYLPPTLADLLPALVQTVEGRPSPPPRAVHRLDKDTTGAVAFARTVEAERDLGKQFRGRTTERTYLALVRGQAQAARIESWLVENRGDGRRGSGPEGEGEKAVTHVTVVERLGEFTLVECRLETGRTHQVRIHLGEAETPLCGERVYDRPINGRPLPDGSGAKRAMLHAYSLGLDHPATGQRLCWRSPLPRDMDQLLLRLREQRQSGA